MWPKSTIDIVNVFWGSHYLISTRSVYELIILSSQDLGIMGHLTNASKVV